MPSLDDEEQPAHHGNALAADRRRRWNSRANVALLRLLLDATAARSSVAPFAALPEIVQGTRELSVAVGSLRGSLRGDAIATASLSRSVQGAGAGGYGVFPGGRGRKRCCCVDGGERVRCLTGGNVF